MVWLTGFDTCTLLRDCVPFFWHWVILIVLCQEPKDHTMLFPGKLLLQLLLNFVSYFLLDLWDKRAENSSKSRNLDLGLLALIFVVIVLFKIIIYRLLVLSFIFQTMLPRHMLAVPYGNLVAEKLTFDLLSLPIFQKWTVS